jgi:RimJ/RimL family protein N-acetyltransferase
LTLATPRLDLIAANPDIAYAEATGEPHWWRRLRASSPVAWPPPLNDASSLRWYAEAVTSDPDGVGWYTWYVLERDASLPRRLIGNAGFTGRPDPSGSAEIGYALLPLHQQRGYGTELVRALVDWAFRHADVKRVMAETYPDFIASVRVLEKNGFTLAGRAARPGAIRYELRRSVFVRRFNR